MADAPSYDDIRESGVQEILRKPTRFDPAIVDTEGSDVEVVVSVGASMSAESVGFAQQTLLELSLSTAANEGGEVLERFLWDRYQLVRQDSQQAVAPLTLLRETTDVAASVPAGTVIATNDGVTFETVNEVVFAVGNSGPLLVTAFSQVAGVIGNVGLTTLNTIISNIADKTITVTNVEVAAGGQDEETDLAFAERGRDFFVNARRGTRQAILTGCLTTPGVAQATVTEDLDKNGDPFFRVQAIISDLNGQANSSLAAAVVARSDEFRALGVPLRVIAGAPQFVSIVIEGIRFEFGANTTTLIDQLRDNVVTAVNLLAPNKPLEQALILSALKISNQVNIPADAVVSPAGDLLPTGNTGVIRTTSERVTINGLAGSIL